MTTRDVLQVSGLSIRNANLPKAAPVLQDVSFSAAPKSVVGIIGESGAGKTVLAKALVNWVASPLEISSGQLFFEGVDLLKQPAERFNAMRGREISYIGADPTSALDPTVPVGSQIVKKLVTVKPTLSKREAKEFVIETFQAVRIPSASKRFNDYPFQFSGGMMQRALIVDALVTNPKLLIADNITQPLDVTVAAQILRLLRQLQQDFETAIVFVTASLGTAVDIADKVLVMKEGRVVESGGTSGLLANPQDDYTKQLIHQVPDIWGAEPFHSEQIDEHPILSIRDVSKTYQLADPDVVFGKQAVQAVRGVSFDVRRGENFGVIGESGCGKSTLSRLLSALESPDTGEVLFNGTSLSSMSSKQLLNWRQKMQLILQDPYNSIPSYMTIGDIIAEPLRIHNLEKGNALWTRVKAVMTEVGLNLDLIHDLPAGLSAGQRQRVSIARALVLEPEVLILDETLSALDQVEQSKLLALFADINRRRSITCIYISHDLAMVRRICDRIGVMYLGKVVELADNESLFSKAGHPYTRALLSAVPVLEEKPFEESVYLLDGEPPDPINIPAGCSFRTRCPFAIDQCAQEEPNLEVYEEKGSAAACYVGYAKLP
ncbi:dipeptide ABC transporter ATP-binding protein [Spiribacter sp. C176]|uniref:Dipeptide ABC transporter ATP-binding protein n=1 Tax=Spiribacter salilacus TaxID=2664894 RepID=A0A6N7QPR8_9GAMM|nr:ABC transporter ATP-binding protein [Spiribacter salilacus]MRH78032.1 dipeptide ABC transporter ATP-binding protein [Spiribacter salilacus]